VLKKQNADFLAFFSAIRNRKFHFLQNNSISYFKKKILKI
jgi:hypothetical protein